MRFSVYRAFDDNKAMTLAWSCNEVCSSLFQSSRHDDTGDNKIDVSINHLRVAPQKKPAVELLGTHTE
jgi:hypothetical protein